MKVTVLSKLTGELTKVDYDVTSVVLTNTSLNRFRMFFCPNCQNPVIQYTGAIVLILPGAVPSQLPIVVQCANSNCRSKFLFERIVSRSAILE